MEKDNIINEKYTIDNHTEPSAKGEQIVEGKRPAFVINQPLILTEVFPIFKNMQPAYAKPLIFSPPLPEFKNKPK